MKFLENRLQKVTANAQVAVQSVQHKSKEITHVKQIYKIRRADQEFLPAALQILETPPSPVRLAIMGTISAFAVVAMIWAYVGRIDIMAIAQGKIQALGRTKIIQPLDAGRVKKIFAENGRKVSAGEILIELDANVSQAEENTLQASLYSFEAEVLRRQAALSIRSDAALEVPSISWSHFFPKNIIEREQRILESDVSKLSTAIASFNASASEKTAERDRLTGTISAEERLIAVLKERVGMRVTLLDKAVGSRSNVLDSLESLETQLTYLANIKGQAAQALAAINVAHREIDKAYASFILENSQKLSEAERQSEDVRTRLAKARFITDHSVIRSPIDGIIQGVTTTSVGQVVQSGEQIMQVVPLEGPLEVESYLLNLDIGFVRKGQEASVKLEAFPFNRYGTIDAIVTRVADDAIPEVDARQREENPSKSGESRFFGGAQRTQNLVFPMTLTLSRSEVVVDGRSVRLMPGMAVTVEIKTGSRRILEYLFSPLTEALSTSFRER